VRKSVFFPAAFCGRSLFSFSAHISSKNAAFFEKRTQKMKVLADRKKKPFQRFGPGTDPRKRHRTKSLKY
jgi:hypothetical protein